ncbi:MAG TPA: histidinol dehydrogenase, partial [Lachnospiraceae bacterium]|nr:histidinol dehydrogenase [Lachnospiraceae bacterium]
MRIVDLTKESRAELLELLKGRNPASFTGQQKAVDEIIGAVRTRGDAALFEYEKKFDHCDLTPGTIRVTRQEIDEAFAALDPRFIEVMKRAAANITAYHEKQRVNSWITTKPDG